ncbi:hypothetical protein M0R45_026809 [Rubus argutus]|uniref:Uncharacterized protein n=1 Tax=Rubus argutus TaxID=59490 RepID=A0AAW1WYH8_RUBAR
MAAQFSAAVLFSSHTFRHPKSLLLEPHREAQTHSLDSHLTPPTLLRPNVANPPMRRAQASSCLEKLGSIAMCLFQEEKKGLESRS